MGGRLAGTDTRRRRTVFEPCPKHSSWFAPRTGYGSAEVFVEGGPAGLPCGGGLCEMKPWTDFYSSTFADPHPVHTGVPWAPNRQAVPTQGCFEGREWGSFGCASGTRSVSLRGCLSLSRSGLRPRVASPVGARLTAAAPGGLRGHAAWLITTEGAQHDQSDADVG